MILAGIADELAELTARGLRRRLRTIDGSQAAELSVDGRRVANFSSNNYLGLADHPHLAEASTTATREGGFGAGASRLIAGNLAAHRALESSLASWQQSEAALLFNSGYHANVGIVSALVGPEDAVYSDALNHASLIDGARLSRAHIHVYPHRDLDALRERLAAGRSYRRRLLLTDTLFSMDGDQADLPELVALARAHDALTLVDEAHAVGVLGPEGRGLSAGLPVDLRMGTFGKALGGFGAFVATSRLLADYLLHRARSFVFTTALPVPVVAWAHAAIRLVAGPEGQARRDSLARNGALLHEGLRRTGVAASSPAHIVPVRVGDPDRTMALSEALLEAGVFVQGIRPPTVPTGTARLRVALMATHTEEQIAALLAAIERHRDLLPR